MIVRRKKGAVTARLLTVDEMVSIDGNQVQGRVGQYVVHDDDEKMILDKSDFDELYEVVARKMPVVPQGLVVPGMGAQPAGDPQVLPRP